MVDKRKGRLPPEQGFCEAFCGSEDDCLVETMGFHGLNAENRAAKEAGSVPDAAKAGYQYIKKEGSAGQPANDDGG